MFLSSVNSRFLAVYIILVMELACDRHHEGVQRGTSEDSLHKLPNREKIGGSKALPPTERGTLEQGLGSDLTGQRLPARDEQKLPFEYEHLSQKKLLHLVEATERCVLDTGERQKRFVRQVLLPQQNARLLALACDLGAYQDSYLVYFVRPNGEEFVAVQLTWSVPLFSGSWTREVSSRLVGSLEVDPSSNRLRSLRLYSAFGSCGYQVEYSLDSLELSLPASLLSVHADNDCNNGILVDEWPEIQL